MLGAVPGHADDGAGDDSDDSRNSGGWMYISPKVRPNSVDFASYSTATGTAVGTWATHFSIRGLILQQDQQTVVNTFWSQAAAKPGRSKIEHHVYSLAGASSATFVYTGSLFAPGSSMPTATCESILRIKPGAPAEIDGTC